MALNISFTDFDTTCYNLQHNVIELIKHTVGISIEINSNQAAIDQQIADLNRFDDDIFEIVGNVIGAMNDVNVALNNIMQLLQNHEIRLQALEAGRNGG